MGGPTDDVRTVLIVEDEPDLAGTYAGWLSEYDVRVARDCESALDAVDDRIDVALLDRKLPDGSGDEVLAEIRRQGYGCRVAMVTAVEPGFEIVEMGFDDYLAKPVDREELVGTVDRLLRRAAYADLLREFYALAAKRAILETYHPDELAGSDEYAALVARLGELREELNATTNGFRDAEFWAEVGRLGT